MQASLNVLLSISDHVDNKEVEEQQEQHPLVIYGAQHWVDHACQGLAGPWYARREREAVKARFQWFKGSRVQMRARAQARQKTRGKQWIARNR